MKKTIKGSDLTHIIEITRMINFIQSGDNKYLDNLVSFTRIDKPCLESLCRKVLLDNNFSALTEKERSFLYIEKEILLRSAVYSENIESVQFLLKNGANPTVLKNVALHDAIKKNNKEIVEVLLSFGSDPNEDNGFLLLEAIYRGNIEIVMMMNKSDIAVENHFVHACHFSTVEIVEYFINKGYNIELAKNSKNETISKWANAKYLAESLSLSLETKAPSNKIKKV